MNYRTDPLRINMLASPAENQIDIKCFRGDQLDVPVELYEDDDVADLSNVSSITMLVKVDEFATAAIMSQTASGGDFENNRFTYSFTSVECNLSEAAQDANSFYCVIWADKNNGEKATLAKGQLLMYWDGDPTNIGPAPTPPDFNLTSDEANARYVRFDTSQSLTSGEKTQARTNIGALATNGDGSGLTNLNASALASGTVPDARFPATLPAVSGANLTALNASNIASGTLPDARLSNTAVTPGSYTATNLTVDAHGRITAASNGGGAGTGDVVGPASAVNGNTVLFDGTTGKLIKDAGFAPQPVNSNLTAIAALTTTSYGRSLLTLASDEALAESLGLSINVKVYGAAGDARGTSDATTTSGSPTVTSPTMAFTSDDIGKVVWVSEAVNGSPYGYKCIVGTVLAVGSATSITVSANATRSVAGAGRIVLGTDDTAACSLAVAAAIIDGKEISIPGGGYIISGDLGFGSNSGIDVNGGGTGATTIYLSPNYDWTTLPNNYGALFDGARSVNRLSMEGGNWPFTFEIPATGIVAGEGYTIVTPGTTDFVAIGAANNDPYTVFTATGAGTGTGTVTRAYPTYSVMRSADSATDIAIARFNGFTYGFKCLASGADYEHIHVLDCSYIGIWVGGSAAVISDSYAGNCGYCSLFVASTAVSPNTGTHFIWSGGVVDESTTASAIVDGCANADIAFTNTEFLGPEGGYGCVISNSSTVRFTACNIIPYTTGNRGGLSIDATSAAFLVNSRLSGDGTKFALLNAGSAYDGGGNTIEGTGISGTALVNALSSIVSVPHGGTAASSFTAYSVLCGGTTATSALQSVASVGTSGQVLTSNGAGALPTFQNVSAGTVTSVAQSFTGGLISVGGSPITGSGTLALTVAGTSGGIPYFSSASTWASSAALAANAIVIGGGAGVAPSTTTTGTGVLTALGVNTGSAGAFVVDGGALGTPSSGTLTSCTGLPISTGVSGLGTGVATTLATNLSITGGGTIALGGFTLTVPATGTAALLSANTFTGIQTLPAGSVSAPSLTHGDSTSGWYRPTTNAIGLTTSGKIRWDLEGGYMYWFADGAYTGTGVICRVDCSGSYSSFDMGRDRSFGWMNDLVGTAARDVSLNRGGAGILELKNSTNAQTFRIYGTTTGSKYLSLAHDGTNAVISASSGAVGITGNVTLDKTITAGGTTGAQTINKTSGSVNFAAAATSLVVTNSLCSTSSVIVATVATNDTTMKDVQVVAGSGSFTIYPDTAPTAETRVNFIITN